ncbi:MAG: gluconate 2-dehydrogenase subunit 3 family protein [Caulobacteraceae bacterium]|nr:gluconate 2-dehydrogenase subunit 3 family protein [Caulobacter sp.]
MKLDLSRRRLLAAGVLAGGAAATAEAFTPHDGALGGPPQTLSGAVPWRGGAADAPPGVEGTDFRFFTPAERAFVTAAADRLIPPDPTGPSASEAGVPFFIDRQLAGLYGQGQHYYLGGPWPKGAPEQGYQSRFSPAELYRKAIAASQKHVGDRYNGAAFEHLKPGDQDAVLKDLEGGKVELDGVDAKTFFDMLLQNTKEGYFSDPMYGGNRGMAAWKMIGFPGAHYDYKEWAGRHGERAPFPPVAFKGRPGWTQG